MICETIVDEVLGGTDKLLLHFDNISCIHNRMKNLNEFFSLDLCLA